MGLLGILFGKNKTDQNNTSKKVVYTVEDGMKAYDKKNYQIAFPILLKAAEEGNAEAAYRCGWMWLKGQGTEGGQSSYQKAAEWYERAAEQGHIEAQCECGNLYSSNRTDLKKDKAKSLYWYEKAAEAGSPEAMYECGNIYSNGDGVRRDLRKAFRLYEEAGKAGYAKAQFECGWMCMRGQGTKKNVQKAVYWYEEAGKAGYLYALKECWKIFYYGFDVPENKERALYWMEKLVEQLGWDREESVRNMCIEMYEKGIGGLRDAKGNLFEQEKRAIEGSCKDQLYCGSMYRHNSKNKNDIRSLYWYTKAAEQGDPEAQFACGLIYEKGEGTSGNRALAIEWYKKAAMQDYAKAQYNLYLLYDESDEERSDIEAYNWLRRAVSGGYAKAQFAMGLIKYEEEIWGPAYDLVKQAADQGLQEAIEAIRGGEDIQFQGRDVIYVSKNFHRILIDWQGGKREKAGCEILFSEDN